MFVLVFMLLATAIVERRSACSSPIASDLLTRAHASGNAFVFLMTGAATDYTEIFILLDTTRSGKATPASHLAPQVLLIGWIINHLST